MLVLGRAACASPQSSTLNCCLGGRDTCHAYEQGKEQIRFPTHVSGCNSFSPKLQPEVLNMWCKDRQPAPIAEATKVKTPFQHRSKSSRHHEMTNVVMFFLFMNNCIPLTPSTSRL